MLCWIDLETTGLNPYKHRILEIAMIVTSDDLETIHGTATALITKPWNSPIDPFVQKMHEESGLWKDLSTQPTETVWTAELRLVRMIKNWGVEPNTIPLAGETVHFDRKMLASQMPTLEAYFHYRNFDMRSIKTAAQLWSPWRPQPPKEITDHRALLDILATIEVAKFYKRELFEQGAPS